MNKVIKKLHICCIVVILLLFLSGCQAGQINVVNEIKNNLYCLYQADASGNNTTGDAMKAVYAKKVEDYISAFNRIKQVEAFHGDVETYKTHVVNNQKNGFIPYFEGKHTVATGGNPGIVNQINNNIAWILSPNTLIRLLNWFNYASMSMNAKAILDNSIHHPVQNENQDEENDSRRHTVVTGNWYSSYGCEVGDADGPSAQNEDKFPSEASSLLESTNVSRYNGIVAALGKNGLIGNINRKVNFGIIQSGNSAYGFALNDGNTLIGTLKGDSYNPTRKHFTTAGVPTIVGVTPIGQSSYVAFNLNTSSIQNANQLECEGYDSFNVRTSGEDTDIVDNVAETDSKDGETTLTTLGESVCQAFVRACRNAGRQGFSYYTLTAVTIEGDLEDKTSYTLNVYCYVAEDYIYNPNTFSKLGVPMTNNSGWSQSENALTTITNIESRIKSEGVFLEDDNIDELTSKDSKLGLYGFNTVADYTNSGEGSRDINTPIRKFIYINSQVDDFQTKMQKYQADKSNKKLGEELINHPCITKTNEILNSGDIFVSTDSTRVKDSLTVQSICQVVSSAVDGQYNGRNYTLNDDLIVTVEQLPVYAIRLNEVRVDAVERLLNSRDTSTFAGDTFEVVGDKSGAVHIKKQVAIQYVKGFNTDGSLLLDDTGVTYCIDENKYMYDGYGGKSLSDTQNADIKGSAGWDFIESFMQSPDEGKMVLAQYYTCYKEPETEIEGWMPLGRKVFLNSLNTSIEGETIYMNYDNPVFFLADPTSNKSPSTSALSLSVVCDKDGQGNENIQNMSPHIKLNPIYQVREVANP